MARGAWYGENNVDLVLGSPASRIDPKQRAVTLANGQIFPYTKLLLATGARPRTIPLSGADLDGVLSDLNLARTSNGSMRTKVSVSASRQALPELRDWTARQRRSAPIPAKRFPPTS